jgi:hypothetical protein
MTKKSKQPLNVIINSRNSSFYSVMEDLITFQRTSGLIEKNGLMIICSEVDFEEVDESEYDIHAGTEFSNKKNITKPRRSYVQIDEIYRAIDEFVKPGLVNPIKNDIKKRFPSEIYQKGFPYADTFEYLFNHLINIAKKENPEEIIPKYIN